MAYTIKQVSDKLDLPVSKIRYYEKKELLPIIKRDEHNNRVYTESDIEWLYLVKLLREANVSIQNIREYVTLLFSGSKTMKQRQILLETLKEDILFSIMQQQQSLAFLDKKISFYQENNQNIDNLSCSSYQEEWELFKKSQGEKNE